MKMQGVAGHKGLVEMYKFAKILFLISFTTLYNAIIGKLLSLFSHLRKLNI